jgi:hypothetical protein
LSHCFTLHASDSSDQTTVAYSSRLLHHAKTTFDDDGDGDGDADADGDDAAAAAAAAAAPEDDEQLIIGLLLACSYSTASIACYFQWTPVNPNPSSLSAHLAVRDNPPTTR